MLKLIGMQKVIGLIFLIISIVSCNQRAGIPEKDMVSILTKMEVIDASVDHLKQWNKQIRRDSIGYNSLIIESFGYSKAQFDSALSYYSRNPKELDAIYDKVIIELLKIETDIANEKKEQFDSINRDSLKNIWSLKPQYNFPEDDSVGKVDFFVPVKGFGKYTISVGVRFFEDDNSIDPSMHAFFYFDDKSKEGNKSSYISKVYSKDRDTINYTIQLDLQNSLVTHIKGSLFDYKNNSQEVKRHALLTNIKVYFKPVTPRKKKVYSNRKELLKED